MNLNGTAGRSDSTAHRTNSTIPAPSSDLLGASPEVAAYVRASERVRAALEEQRPAIAALRELDSRHPEVTL